VRPLRDTAVHSVAFVTDGSSWWEVDLIDRDQPNDEPWVGHIQPAHVGPMRGKLPPANEVGADPVEMRAAELIAWFNDYDGDIVSDASDGEDHGWVSNRFSVEEEVDAPGWLAGWLAAEATS